jgi:threonyl-tRNA synthetase
VVLPVADAQLLFAQRLVRAGVSAGSRAELSGPEHGTLSARIKASRQVPHQAVIGAREQSGEEAALRLREGRQLAPLPVADLLVRIGRCIASRTIELWPKPAPSWS